MADVLILPNIGNDEVFFADVPTSDALRSCVL